MDFRIAQLRSFLALAESLNYAKTARSLFMTQPTLSVQIRSLEQSMGVSLFDRSRQRVQLTDAGLQFVSAARRILRDVESFQAEFCEKQAASPLRVSCSQTGQYEFLPKLLRLLDEEAPQLRLQLHTMVQRKRIDDLLSHKLDALFMVPPTNTDGVSYQLVRKDPVIAVLPAREPFTSMDAISIAKFSSFPIITTSRTDCSHTAHFCEALLDSFGFKPELVEVSADHSTQMAIIAAGQGVGIASAITSSIHFPGLVRLPFSEDLPLYSTGVAWRTADTSPKLKLLIDSMMRVARSPMSPKSLQLPALLLAGEKAVSQSERTILPRTG